MTTLLLVVGYTSMAQEGLTGGPTPPPPPPPSIPSLPGLVVPIDENIVLLLILGMVTGVIYYVRNRASKA